MMTAPEPQADRPRMRAQDRRVPIEQLLPAIEQVLKSGPRVIDQIAREVGYSVGAVRSRLQQLELENRAHRRRVIFENWSGICYHWYHGAAVDAMVVPQAASVQEALGPEQQAVVPFQCTVRTYPAINRRDPLVAALFGPMRQAAA